jgi:hypothetical protein
MALPLLRLALLLLTECEAGGLWRLATPAGHASALEAVACQPLQVHFYLLQISLFVPVWHHSI